mmetsp:Transcript_41618/g.109792  ORF Transcript_41618/g.109792 Transcript_41618/m.109792 type:complete len:174 (-) Transcript_41618:361-882(-)
MGGDLASWMASSGEVSELVRAGRASQAERQRHWDCGFSDVTLGYALGAANRSITLVSVRDAMRDATYGAMNARRFVVSHHLRQKKQFEAAHREALTQPAWSPAPPKCSPWTQVDHVGLPWAERAEAAAQPHRQRGGESPADVQRAMRAFGCCQTWQLCEVGPEGVASPVEQRS